MNFSSHAQAIWPFFTLMMALPYNPTPRTALQPGPLLVHTVHQQFLPLPHPTPVSYLGHTVQPSIPKVIAAMEVRLPTSTKVGPWGSCPVREAVAGGRCLGWASLR